MTIEISYIDTDGIEYAANVAADEVATFVENIIGAPVAFSDATIAAVVSIDTLDRVGHVATNLFSAR